MPRCDSTELAEVLSKRADFAIVALATTAESVDLSAYGGSRLPGQRGMNSNER
jgi:hypothetical protein